MYVPKISFVAYKPSNKAKDVRGNDYDNINQTLETMTTCDKPLARTLLIR